MQGVRTTRSCVNCRQKKKGCDMKKPTCGRCLRLKMPCAFEERRYVFISHGGDPSTTSSLTSSSETSWSRTSSSIILDEYFWTNYLPQEDPTLDGSIGGILSAPWIPTIRQLANQNSDVRYAIQACALAGLGWMSEDQTLIIRSGAYYAQALKQTNVALQDPASACDDSVLACCRLLSLFEMLRRIASPGNSNRDQVLDWRTHVNGTCRLVQLRGRQKHVSGHGVELYDGVRLTAIIQGLVRRQPNAFTKFAWKLPRRNMRDELFELINPVPQLLHDFDVLHKCEIGIETESASRQHIVLGLGLLRQSVEICYALREWEVKVLSLCEKRKFSDCRAYAMPTSQASQEEASLFDSCKSYGHGFFAICAQYWTMCNILYGSLRTFRLQLQVFMDIWTPGDKMPVLPEWIGPEMPAVYIAQVASHFFKPGMGLWAAYAAVFPVSTALCHFARTGRRDSPAVGAMVDAFATSKTGIIMRDFLDAIGLS